MSFSILNSGCKKEDCVPCNATPDTPTVQDEYYVKYIVTSTTIYSGGKLNVTIRSEQNQDLVIIVSQNTKSETVIGPVSKGFVAQMWVSASGETYDKLKLNTEIQVSKNAGPFAIKAIDGSNTPRDAVNLNYTIDY